MKKEFKNVAIEVIKLKKVNIVTDSCTLVECTDGDSCGSTDTCNPDM